jgi:hypothetical protein
LINQSESCAATVAGQSPRPRGTGHRKAFIIIASPEASVRYRNLDARRGVWRIRKKGYLYKSPTPGGKTGVHNGTKKPEKRVSAVGFDLKSVYSSDIYTKARKK